MDQKNDIFQVLDSLIRRIYGLTLTFPYKYQSSAGDQLRRASLSVILNIVEGGARKSLKERKQFLNITFSSLKETKYLLYFASTFGLIKEEDYQVIIEEVNRIARRIYGILYKKY